jgi:site-specific DNA-methyltransferase (adenine-specific)
MVIKGDCLQHIKDIPKGSVDLILTDPPYLISRKSSYHIYSDNANKEMITKYAKHSIDFGDWDKESIDWEELFKEYFRVLKDGGTLIFFFDIWKSSEIKEIAEACKFKQPRVCSWQKTNPVPINSKRNYLSNANEYFFSFTKGKKPTFNSEYDNGIYKYPICHGKERIGHPTQKPLSLISELIKKHSKEGDLVLDTFAGSGTTGEAAHNLGRKYILIEKSDEYIELIKNRLNLHQISSEA